mgnify:CR=1 FL=1
MEWLAENWFWVLVGILFVVVHLFGHGGGAHNHGQPPADKPGADNARDHQH